MRTHASVMTAVVLSLGVGSSVGAEPTGHPDWEAAHRPADRTSKVVQLGPRPFYLVDKLAPGRLKNELSACMSRRRFRKSDWSIGHRGAPLQFPEHTEESYVAAARMGAGILECDVTFTKDLELVCRHAQCDLHTTTNILATPLAAKCTSSFRPAEFDPVTGERTRAASAKCCASDITLQEFKTLYGKMDASDPNARTVDEYLGGTAPFRTDLYATEGKLLSHRESIELFKSLGAKMTPELKSPDASVQMPFMGVFSQEDYAQKMIDEYRQAGVRPRDVYAQSFNLDDVLYWIAAEPAFGRQAVFLEGRNLDPEDPATWSPSMDDLRDAGVRILGTPMPVLLGLNGRGQLRPSRYARRARRAGLDIIAWTTERSGRIAEDVVEGGGTFYYSTTLPALRNDGDILRTLDVLSRRVGIKGIFSDWPATTTFYANCRGL